MFRRKFNKITVGELINELQKYPENKLIEIVCAADGGGETVGGGEITIFEERNTIQLYNDEC